MRFKISVKGKINIPNLDLTNILMEIGKKDIVARLAKNIQQGIDLQERSYPSLAASTIKKKGHDRPLIETGKLHSSFQVAKIGKNKVMISINTARREIAKFLLEGIRTKRGKRIFNFFGVSTRMENDGRRRLENEIKVRIKNAR